MKLIIFIHGALSSKRSFSYIKGKLNANMSASRVAGRIIDPKLNDEWEMRDFSYNITKEPGKETVERLVKQLTGYIKTFEVEQLVLIGHSFGGVLAVDAVRRLERPDVPTSIVALATPFGGVGLASLLALFKKSTFLDNVGTYEPFVKEFLKKPLPCRTRRVITTTGSADFLPTENDGVVSIESQMALVDDPNSSFIKVKLNHFEVLLSEEVIDIIIKELNRDPLKATLKKAA